MRVAAACLLLRLVFIPCFCETEIDEWETFSPADLALTDNPHETGARAMYLYTV